jgi:polysaccharide biosynthesis transport protein
MADEARTDAERHIITESIRRHAVFVLVIVIAFTCAGIGYALLRPSHYTSTAKVLIRPLTGNNLSPDTLSSGQQVTVAMTTEAGLVTSPDVYARVQEALRPQPVPPPSAVTALVPPNTTIVQVRVTAGSAVVAANGAQAYANAFLAYRAGQTLRVRDTELTSLHAQERQASAKLTAASASAASQKPPPDAATQVQLWATRLATIKGSIGDLEATDKNPGSVVAAAVPPSSPDGLNPILLVLAAIIIGLGVGAVLAIWRDRRDDRVRTAYDHSVAGVPMLATLPGNRRVSPRRIAELHAEDELRTCYRRARAGVIASTTAPSVLVVSSVDRGTSELDPAGEVAANLGWSLTGAGFTVTLVDATIGLGQVAELLGVEPRPGLSEQLVASGSAAPVTQQVLGMSVVPAGHDPEDAREFYAGARLAKALGWFTGASDYLIVAGPPIGTPDGEAVALVGDALLLVVVDKETTHGRSAVVLQRVNQLRVRVVGAVGLQHRARETPRLARRGRRKAPVPVIATAEPAGPTNGTHTDPPARHAPQQSSVPRPAGSGRGDDGH